MLQLLILLTIIASVVFFGYLAPIEAKIFLYSVSLSIKEILLFVMPFIVFALIFSSINDLKQSAIKFILLLVIMIFLSNLVSSLIAYSIGHFLLKNTYSIQDITYEETIAPLWSFKLPLLLSNFHALAYGFISSLIVSVLLPKKSKELSRKMSGLTSFVLKVFLIPVIPVFVLGLALKMQHDQVLSIIFKDCSIIFVIIISVTYFYVFLLYGAANSFKITNWITSISNMMPAFITAISTMSSSATMPLTLEGSKKNVKQPDVASSVILMTSGFHLVGDCFFIIILSVVITSGYALSTTDYVTFLLYFLLFKFAIAAVPAGGIIAMLPVLERYLKFSPEMLSLIAALYVVFDPIITSANVMGNGAFTIMFIKLYDKLR
ncbi:cation:dicarboxylase symporter family transporter [Wolbachia endosymbiont of Mansonella ozzardi]|uniref:cation:dicarboxylate symporter family transporter n=1 Tax=Wolbachia endosymbiont of Mansonella ozzardi TaxID=137464 RepID=UPI001CE205AB|nr:cation:dicarboxylase symporter family transporter [Wolbachia endosymbiont of Mansonella ozzardi]MCA4774942.1 cation:dicarboxylase symporter family transporter [Wolbachia endosymbiont of Mansonella ozzardi]